MCKIAVRKVQEYQSIDLWFKVLVHPIMFVCVYSSKFVSSMDQESFSIEVGSKICYHFSLQEEQCCTIEAPDNRYTKVQPRYYVNHPGMRIDYILYGTKPACHVTCQECRLTFKQIPGTNMSYSDHTGVEALFELKKVNGKYILQHFTTGQEIKPW